MSSKDTTVKLKESCQQLLQIIEEKDKQIESLQNCLDKGITGQNTFNFYMGIFKDFVSKVKNQNWVIEGKYNTKSSRDFINVDFAKYIEFLSENLPEQQHGDFKILMESLQLIDAQSKNCVGYGKDRIKIVKIRAEAYRRLVN